MPINIFKRKKTNMFLHTLLNVMVASQLVLSENMLLKNFFFMIRELYLLKRHTTKRKAKW